MWIAKPSEARCTNCGKQVEKFGNNVKWCSKKCREQYKRMQVGVAPLPLEIACACCGKIIHNPRSVTQKFCSTRCSMGAFRQKQRKARLKAIARLAREKAEKEVVNVTDEYLRLEEVAGNLRISVRSLFRLINQSKIKTRKIGKRTIVRRQDIPDLFKDQP